jgi:hypothetical protein
VKEKEEISESSTVEVDKQIPEPKPKKDLISVFRETRRQEQTQKPKGKPGRQLSKHQELKSRLHKQILQ